MIIWDTEYIAAGYRKSDLKQKQTNNKKTQLQQLKGNLEV